MRDVTTLGSAIAAVAAEMLDRSLQLIPAVLGAVLLLVVGWILARVLRAVAQRAFVLLDALVTRMLPASGGRVRLGRSGGVLGAIVFWIVLLLVEVVRRQSGKESGSSSRAVRTAAKSSGLFDW